MSYKLAQKESLCAALCSRRIERGLDRRASTKVWKALCASSVWQQWCNVPLGEQHKHMSAM